MIKNSCKERGNMLFAQLLFVFLYVFITLDVPAMDDNNEGNKKKS